MRLIALATATGVPGACLFGDGTVLADWRGDPRSGPQAVLAGVAELLQSAGLRMAQVDGFACGRGPGAFTGVRLGLALGQGLALGRSRPLVTVSDLQALAWKAWRQRGWERILACTDARKGEVYWGAFECSADGIFTRGGEAVGPPAVVAPSAGRWALAGSGTPALLGAGFPAVASDDLLAADAEAVAALAEPMLRRGSRAKPEEAVPVYLRERVAAASRGGHNSPLA